MTEERELKIPFQEASRISVECDNAQCRAELTIDLSLWPEWKTSDLSCAACGKEQVIDLNRILKELISVRRTVAKAKVFFRIRLTNSN